MYEKCPMCGMEDNIEEFNDKKEWKSVLICYGCSYVEIKKKFYVKTKEEEDVLCKFEEGFLKETKQEG